MTVEKTADARAAAAQTVLTRAPGTALRRSVFWIAATVFVVVVSVIGLLISGSGSAGPPLSATNPAPAGAKALVEVLKQQGVDVTVAESLDDAVEAVDAAGDPDDTTLLYYDPDRVLEGEQRDTAFGLAGRTVLVAPGFDQLDSLDPDIAQGGSVSGEVQADCSLPAAERAGSIGADGSGFRYLGDEASALACFDSGDDVSSLIQVETDAGLATVVGSTDVFDNEHITQYGNAALALGLLGESTNLVWYLPGLADLATDAPPTLGELSPDWVIPVAALLLLTVIAAGVWRGRRFGPLIVENLPVTVRANETMQGRARLYEKSSARLRALDALRIGSIERIAALCRLPRIAGVDDVVAAVGALTGAPPNEVHRVLVGAIPASDGDLVRLSDELLVLERAVAASARIS
jgi:hypothetical protein